MRSREWLSAVVAVLAVLGSACSSDNASHPKGSAGSTAKGEGGGEGGASGNSTASEGKAGKESATHAGGGAGAGESGGNEESGASAGSKGASESGGGKSAGSGGSATGSGGAATSAGGRTGKDGGLIGKDGGLGKGGAAEPAGGSGGAQVATGDGGGASEGCGSANTTSPCGAKGTSCTLNVNSKDRKYYVQLPKTYSSSKQYPVIFQFHPWGGSADMALTMYGLNSGIPDAIYITPQGLDAGGNGPGWANTGGEDIAFTKAMLADVQSKYCVDSSRIFSTGFSYGGMMSFAIGCEMSNVFRAIAPMSGSLYSDTGCKGTGPHIAMWGSHGTSDSVVPIADGRSARDKILKENHCGTDTTPVDPSPCVKYSGCDPGYDVTWCEWDGPHGMPNFGSSAITAFFKTFL